MENLKFKMQNYGKSFILNFKFSIGNPPIPPLEKGGKGGFEKEGISGFTLLEILVALAILGIAITIILQLFSANLRALSVSENYVSAVTKAEAKMREILDDTNLSEKSWSEVTDDGYRFDASITETLKDRTENLQVRLLEVALTVQWTEGIKKKSLTLKTMKVVNKQI
jgi:prepilin-type N-terminal cleavage/methylation domain-containing protein